jgi:hypothetical protein
MDLERFPGWSSARRCDLVGLHPGPAARRLEQEIKRMFQIAARDSEFKKVSAGVGADIDLCAEY